MKNENSFIKYPILLIFYVHLLTREDFRDCRGWRESERVICETYLPFEALVNDKVLKSSYLRQQIPH